MDFTILAVVLLIGVGVPIRNKLIRKYRDKKQEVMNTVFAMRQSAVITIGHTGSSLPQFHM